MGKARAYSFERATLGPHLEGIYLEVSGEDPNRIFISFPGVSFQGHGLYYLSEPGRGSSVNAAAFHESMFVI